MTNDTVIRQGINERVVVLLIAAIQFVNILDFMIVMPLGPDFARELGIASHNMGIIAGSYTAAAALTGIVCSFFLDRFDRRKALAVSILGLMAGTAAAALSWDFYSLIGARVLAGAFGGPVSSLSLAIISDVVPAQRRGRAVGTVMAGFSVASIVGVPLALEVAHIGGWRAPFYAVAGLGLVIAAGVIFLLPPLTIHLMRGVTPPGWAMLRQLAKPLPLLAYGGTAAMMFSAFTLIPHIPSYLVFNLNYTGEAWLADAARAVGLDYKPSVLGPLYLFGGLLSLAVMQIVGRATDRWGSARVSWMGATLLGVVIYLWFVDYNPAIPVIVLFVAFMGTSSLRGVPARTLDTKIPSHGDRASFMSMQSAVQHITLAMAAGLSSLVLTEAPDKSLVGVPNAAWISLAFVVLLPTFVTLAEIRLKRRDAAQAAPNPA
ncbi:MAG: MFS transporter [Planctomycetes bacterium]|jgi:predicted MFS family arabinose efflux permease|nr:MFS transporter [Planctomycetota bacterium]MCL4731280.1 MFS transporter [Planctomycetota bacterium]